MRVESVRQAAIASGCRQDSGGPQNGRLKMVMGFGTPLPLGAAKTRIQSYTAVLRWRVEGAPRVVQ
jgi:hypothetical protein